MTETPKGTPLKPPLPDALSSAPTDKLAGADSADRQRLSKSLRLEQLSMQYVDETGDSMVALEPTDLVIEAGQFVALVGPSGCGKSTLLNIVAGFITPTGGAAYAADQKIDRPDPDRGMVFQDYALFPWLNVVQNVEFGLERKGMPGAQRRSVAMACLQSVGLEQFARRRITELSGGMKQRVAIARTFATEPSVILMDEPFGALDALTRRFLQQQLLGIWQRNKRTVLFVTHSVQEAVYLADRIVVMTARPGRVKCVIDLDLPRPRDFRDAGFHRVEGQVYDQLDEELAKTFGIDAEQMVHD